MISSTCVLYQILASVSEKKITCISFQHIHVAEKA